jgi:hypothetical protein
MRKKPVHCTVCADPAARGNGERSKENSLESEVFCLRLLPLTDQRGLCQNTRVLLIEDQAFTGPAQKTRYQGTYKLKSYIE